MHYLTHLLFLFILSFSLTGCKNNSINSDCSSKNISETDAYQLSVGTWSLLSIKSGWTAEVTKPSYSTILTIDDKQQAIISENGREVVRFNIKLRKGIDDLIYSTSEISSNNYLIPSTGKFKICNKQLIIDANDLDGPRLSYEKI